MSEKHLVNFILYDNSYDNLSLFAEIDDQQKKFLYWLENKGLLFGEMTFVVDADKPDIEDLT